MRLALTDRFVSTAKGRGESQVDYFDSRTPGLALRISPSGHKSWTCHFTSPHDGKRARLTLGSYPATGLAAARTKAIEARGLVEAGEDPRLVLSAQAAGAMTVAMLIESWLAKHVQPELRGAEQIARRLRKSVVPVIGNVRLADLHRRDINRVIDPIIGRGCSIMANRVFADLRACLRWGVARGDLERAPSDGMTPPAKPRQRERVLSDAEIQHLWNALPQAMAQSPACQLVVKLCLATAQRVGEVSGMRRAELNLPARTWTLPGSRTKNGYQHTVPLSDLAVELVREAMAAAPGSPYVFPSGTAPLPADSVTKALVRARPRLGLPHFVTHDCRRTAITGMARLGIAPVVLGHVANHRTTTKAGVTLGIYVHHDYASEKHHALAIWADRLRSIIAGAHHG
jgi:integrase